MSLCYDFEKWTMITLASIAISLTIGLVTLAYGQMPTIEDQQKASCESIAGATWDNGKCIIDKNLENTRQRLINSKGVLYEKQQGLQGLLNYCFQHADRPNPLQDLIDKALLPANMTGITCPAVKQMNDKIQIELLQVDKKIQDLGIVP